MTQNETDELKSAISEIKTDVAVIKMELSFLKGLPLEIAKLREASLVHPKQCFDEIEKRFVKRDEFKSVEAWITGIRAALITALVAGSIGLIYKVAQAMGL